jgi:phosphate transport system substrate-binding protein
MAGCSGKNQKQTESPTSGTLHMSVDESFKPVIDSQIKVFESSFPDVKILAEYKPEAECLKDLSTDSTRMVIITRPLSLTEEKFYEDSFHLTPSQGPLALDAIAVVVNNSSRDSVFEIQDLRDMLTGKDRAHLPVMDGVKETSTVRFAIDSLLRGQIPGKNVTAARSSQEVINYVANTPRAVGFVGVSWIGNPEDSMQISFLKKVSIASLRCTSCQGQTYVKPYQANIALKRYPLVRTLYYILKENYSGVGNNFVNFLQYERGQLIFRRAYLWPARMPFEIRDAVL